MLGDRRKSRRKLPEDDVSSLLEPIRSFAEVLCSAINQISPTINAAENYLKLQLDVRGQYHTAVGHKALRTFFASWEITLIEERPETNVNADALEEAQLDSATQASSLSGNPTEAALKEELTIV